MTRNEIIELCATTALEQRCERGTPWDLACVAIAEKIRGLKADDAGPDDLARAVAAYDAAIRACANDPTKITEYGTVFSPTLDELYARMVALAQQALGIPVDVPEEFLGRMEAKGVS